MYIPDIYKALHLYAIYAEGYSIFNWDKSFFSQCQQKILILIIAMPDCKIQYL